MFSSNHMINTLGKLYNEKKHKSDNQEIAFPNFYYGTFGDAFLEHTRQNKLMCVFVLNYKTNNHQEDDEDEENDEDDEDDEDMDENEDDNDNCYYETIFNPLVVEYMGANFISWPLDYKEQNESFQHYCYENVSLWDCSIFRKKSLPAFIIFMPCLTTEHNETNKRSCLSKCVYGGNNISFANDLLEMLAQETENFAHKQNLLAEYRLQQLKQTRSLIEQQNNSYEESLKIDRAKKINLENLKHKQEQELELRAKKKKSFQNSLPPEPPDTCDSSLIVRIRVFLPGGNFVNRKFNFTDKLQSLIYFVSSMGYFEEEYKILSVWPKQDLTILNGNLTLEHLKINPRETLYVEERF